MKRRTLAVVAGVAFLVAVGVLIEESLIGFLDDTTFNVWVKYQGIFSDGVPRWALDGTHYALAFVTIAVITLIIMKGAAMCESRRLFS